MIVLLLGSFLNILKAQDSDVPSTGTDYILLPVERVKIANVRLNERLHLLNIVEQQELNISSYKDYIHNQDSIILEFQNRIIQANNINQDLNKAIAKQRSKTKTWTATATGLVVVTVLSILLK